MRLIILALAAATASPLPPPGGKEEVKIVIVVHRTNGIEDLSLDALRKIWMGERTYWKGGRPIKLLAAAATDAPKARRVMLERVYQMDERKYRRYWELKKFKGEIAAAPAEKSEEQIIQDVGDDAGAIGYVSAAVCDKLPKAQRDKLKFLTVDGKAVGAEGYPMVAVVE